MLRYICCLSALIAMSCDDKAVPTARRCATDPRACLPTHTSQRVNATVWPPPAVAIDGSATRVDAGVFGQRLTGARIVGGVGTNGANFNASDINTGVLDEAFGGTGNTSYAVGDILYASGATTLSKLADVATGNALISGGVGAAPSYGKVGLTTHVSGVLPIASGGTNSSEALSGSGSIVTHNGTAYTQGPAGTTTTVLHGNAAGQPTYSAVSLTADVSGVLPEASGGTNQSTYAEGDILYASAAGTLARRAIGAGSEVLTVVSGVPQWQPITGGPGGAPASAPYITNGADAALSGEYNIQSLASTLTFTPQVGVTPVKIVQESGGSAAALLVRDGADAVTLLSAVANGARVRRLGVGTDPDANDAVSVIPAAVSGGARAIIVSPASHTDVTSDTADIAVSSRTLTVTDNYDLQRFLSFGQPTITATTPQTVTSAASMFVDGAPTVAGSAVITNTYGISIGASTVGSTVSNTASSTYVPLRVAPHTVTLSNATQVTSAPFAAALSLGQLTISKGGGAVTVDNAATLYVAAAPAAAGSASLTNGYAVWSDSGTNRLDGVVSLGSNLLWQTDGAGDIGASSDLRPNWIYAKAGASVTKTIGATSTDGFVLENTTAAAAGAQQWSPRTRWSGRGWRTASGGASTTVDFIAEVVPIQGVSQPEAEWRLSGQVAGLGYGTPLTIDTQGKAVIGRQGFGSTGSGLTVYDALVVSSNGAAALPVGPTETVVQVGGSDATATHVVVDGYGESGYVDIRQCNGTAASRTATANGDTMGGLQVFGYTGSQYSAGASIIAMAQETWTGSAQGTLLQFKASTPGTNSAAEKMRLTGAANLKIGGTDDRATTEGTNQLVLFNGTAPVGTLTNGLSLYSSSGGLRTLGANGAVTQLSPSVVVTLDDIRGTATDGLVLQNTEDSSVLNQQQLAPRLRMLGSARNTGSASNNDVEATLQLTPTAGNPPTGTLDLGFQINGTGGYANKFKFASGGTLSVLAGAVEVNRDNIGANATDGLLLANATPATGGGNQFSPRLRMLGSGWKTNATAAAQAVESEMMLVPITGAAAPTAYVSLGFQINGSGGFPTNFAFTSGGSLGFGTATPVSRLDLGNNSAGRVLNVNTNGNVQAGLGIDQSGASRELSVFFPSGSGGHVSFGTLSEDGNNTFSEKARINLNGEFVLNGATSGTVSIKAPATVTSWTMTLPPDDGDAGEQLQTDGAGVTTWESAASRREYKNVGARVDPQEALDSVLSAPVYRFRYKPELRKGTGDYKTEYIGVMADEAPWAMHHGGRIVNPVNTLGYMVLAVQALQQQIDGLKTQLASCRCRK